MKGHTVVVVFICLLLYVEADAETIVLPNSADFCPISCTLPLTTLGDGRYYFHTISRLTWPDAYQFCASNRLRLLSIETWEQNNLILRMIDGLEEVFWTSGNDLENEGTWVWRSTGANFTYTGWALGKPTNENCMSIGKVSTQGIGWYDVPCLRKHFFICKRI